MKKVICLLFFYSCLHTFSQTINTSLVYKINQPLTNLGKKTPLLIMLHGYGSNEDDLLGLSKSLNDSLMIISLRAPNTINNGSFCWYKLDFLPDKKFKYNYNEAKISREKILNFISAACKTYALDSNKVFIMGFSQGAIMAYDIALTAPKKIKGVLALSGRMMKETKELTPNWTEANNTHYFIAHGTSDNVINKSESDSSFIYLRSKKMTHLTLKTYNIAHTISEPELLDIKYWLSKAIKL